MPQVCRSIFLFFLCAACYAADQPSSIQLRVAAAQKQLQLNPGSAAALNNLAFALLRQARALEDEAVYAKADALIQQSLQKQAGNFDARKLQVAVLLGLNEPQKALELATELNHKVPDDIAVWALLADCHSMLGNYDQAEKAAQWVLDLRPGSELGFEKAAMLRETFGDPEGALEFLDESIRRTSQNDLDQRSWFLTQKARLWRNSGDLAKASEMAQQALQLSPDSLAAQAELARIRLRQGDNAAAVTLFEGRYHAVPSASHLYEYANALSAAGKTSEASAQFREFEKLAQKDWAGHRSSALELIAYYTDKAPDPGEALRLSKVELARRHDAPLLAAYAWALYRSADNAAANAEITKALEVGIRNPDYFCHAVAIKNATLDKAGAAKYSDTLHSMGIQSCPGDQLPQQAAEVKP